MINPFLRSGEYIPDGEPHVFGDRVYLYGSHDRFGGNYFCMNDYVCYSAPVNNLSDWKFEGVIYRKSQDVNGKEEYLFAPDVVQGTDGRYYLYYSLSNSSRIGVAVCETPAGEYEFYGEVHLPDGSVYGIKKGQPFLFDPAVLVDDGKVYLYSGSCNTNSFNFTEEQMGQIKEKYPKLWQRLTTYSDSKDSIVLRLASDMLTVEGEPKIIAPGALSKNKGSFAGHEFFEASSIRKFNDKYYFIYSSKWCHELCYAISDRPDGGFKYKGVLISNADCGVNGNPDGTSANGNYSTYCGNNHGSVEFINGNYYIFYHKHTNRSSYSRQACLEKIAMDSDGLFRQAELTSSCGDILPLGKYPAYCACLLNYESKASFSEQCKDKDLVPYITQDEEDGEGGIQYLKNVRKGAKAVYKYFDLTKASKIILTVKGKGKILINGSTVDVNASVWDTVITEINSNSKIITVEGHEGAVDILYFELSF